MRYTTVGRTGLRVSELVLGAMTFGEQGGVGAPIEECRRMLEPVSGLDRDRRALGELRNEPAGHLGRQLSLAAIGAVMVVAFSISCAVVGAAGDGSTSPRLSSSPRRMNSRLCAS